MNGLTFRNLSRYIITSFISLLYFINFAQNIDLSHRCGQSILMNHMEAKYPGYQEHINQVFENAKARSRLSRNENEIYKIKVVVHVVWRQEEENIHDSLIISQINTLTEDFRLKNPDRFGMRKIFVNRQADARIEFELHEIRRVQTNRNFTPLIIILPEEVKRTAEGGSDAADPEQFLNIWVCKLQPIPFIGGQVFGYAYPPADLPNWPAGASAPSMDLDGVVIDYRCVGKNTPFSFDIPGLGLLQTNGRTLTHEVGHYLGLRHIWGDGGGILGGDSCSEDDGVADTPNAGRASSQDCDKNQNTCPDDPEEEEPDMVENYMDYSSEFCMNAFTKGQIAIMRSVLEGPRAGLLEEISVGISEKATENVRLFPNPASSQLFLQAIEPVNRVIIRDIQGRIVMDYSMNDFQLHDDIISLNIHSLEDGLYFAEILSAHSSFTARFIVNR